MSYKSTASIPTMNGQESGMKKQFVNPVLVFRATFALHIKKLKHSNQPSLTLFNFFDL